MSRFSQTKKKPLMYRFIRAFVGMIFRRPEFLGKDNLPEEPCLIIANHAQANGPVLNELYYPRKKYIWCIGQMMKMKEVPAYSYKDFWSNKPKWIKWFYKILSYLIAPLSSYVFNRADAIAVYKDTRIVSTYRETMTRLEEGADVIIFPEKLDKHNDIVNDFQDKFVDVARLYYKRTGKILSFVPAYIAPKIRKIVFGKAIKYNPNLNMDEQRKIICDHIKEEITKNALELPRHKVIPYENIGKRKRKYSK